MRSSRERAVASFEPNVPTGDLELIIPTARFQPYILLGFGGASGTS